MKEHVKIGHIIGKHLLSSNSETEENELNSWLEKNENKELYQTILNNNQLNGRLEQYKRINTKRAFNQFINKTGQRKVQLSSSVMRLAAAAGILLVIGISIHNLLTNTNRPNLAQKVINPGTSKAVLELANGAQVILGSAHSNHTITEQGINIQNTDSSLVYLTGNTTNQPLIYNTLTTPVGGEYQVQLADGTKVWLNAQSELQFPVAFSGATRTVRLSGEAYFEVAKNAEQPFIVETHHQHIEVLGTAFNITAYPNKNQTITTLVTGAVEARSSINSPTLFAEKLKASQQLIIDHGNSGTVVVKTVDTYLYSAWKEGRLVYRNQSLSDILDDMKRWYNFDVKYSSEKTKNYRFSIDIPKYDSFDEVVNILELTGLINLETEGNTLMVINNE